MLMQFEGDVYIRPLNRGICLGEDMEDFEDWVQRMLNLGGIGAGGLDLRLRITVERLPDDEAAARTTAGERGAGVEG